MLEEMEEGEGRGLSSVLIFLFILIVLIGVYMFFSSDEAVAPVEDTPSGETERSIMESDEMIDDINFISASAVSGSEIVIAESVILQSPGYVVIHLDDEGRPGAVVGNSELLDEGQHENVDVEIVSELAEGEIIYAMLHRDDGDGEYEFPGDDLPVTDDIGEPVMAVVEVGTLTVETEN